MRMSGQSLFNSNCLDFTQNALWKGLNCHTAPGWFGCEILSIYFVKCCKIAHICQEAGGLKYFVKAAACCFQDGANVLAALLSLSCDVLCNAAVCRIYRYLTRCVDNSINLKSLGVWSDCAWCLFCADYVHFKSSLFLGEMPVQYVFPIILIFILTRHARTPKLLYRIIGNVAR